MKKEKFEELFETHQECFFQFFDSSKEVNSYRLNMPEITESQSSKYVTHKESWVNNGLRILTRPSFGFKNENYYFHVNQIEVTLNKAFFMFIKERDIMELVNNRWDYNKSLNILSLNF